MKKVISLLLASLLLLGLVGCHSSSDKAAAGTPASPEELTETPAETGTAAPSEASPEDLTDAPTEAPTDAPTEAQIEAPTEAPTKAPAPEISTAKADQPEEDMSENELVSLRQVILDNGCICGVLFLGFTDWDEEPFENGNGVWQKFLRQSDAGKEFDFLRKIPQDHILDVGGTEVYCLIPLSDSTAKSVIRTEMIEDGETADVGDPVFTEVSDAPFILRCNVSDIVPNARVTIRTEDARVDWEPFLSLEDSHVVVPVEGGLCDLTVYNY